MRRAHSVRRRPVSTADAPQARPATAAAAGGGRKRPALRERGPLLGAVAVAFVLVILVSAIAPAGAQAITIPNPITAIGGSIGGGIGDLAVGAFDAIIKHIFAPITKVVTVDLIGWLVKIPNFTAADGHVGQLETTVTAMGGGLLGAVATVSIARYWLVGYAGSGFAALEGLARTVAAALALAMWPWLFGQAVALTNLFTSSLLASDSVAKPSSELLATALGAATVVGSNPLGLFIALVITIASALLFLGLLVLKIAISVSTILVFVGMPLAIVVWPVAPWVLGLVGRAFTACLAVPVLWALCFASAAALSADSVTLTGGGTAVEKVIKPLVAIVLLYIMIKLPITLARVAMIGSQAISGSFASRAVSYAAGSRVNQAVGAQLPSSLGGSKGGGSSSTGSSGNGAVRTTAKTAAVGAAAAATGGASAAATGAGAGAATGAGAGASAGGGAAATGGASATGAAGYQPPPTAQARTAAGPGTQHGLPTPAFRKQDFDNEMYEAEHRQQTSPVSVQQARDALQSLPDATRQGVTDSVQASAGDAGRRELAYRATSGDWSPDEREALRTLAAASPEVRAQAIAGSDDHAPLTGAESFADQPMGGPNGVDDRAVLDDLPNPTGDSTHGDRIAGSNIAVGPLSTSPDTDRGGNGVQGDNVRAPAEQHTAGSPGAGPPQAPERRNAPAPREPRGSNPDLLFPDG